MIDIGVIAPRTVCEPAPARSAAAARLRPCVGAGRGRHAPAGRRRTPAEALERLRAGQARFAAGQPTGAAARPGAAARGGAEADAVRGRARLRRLARAGRDPLRPGLRRPLRRARRRQHRDRRSRSPASSTAPRCSARRRSWCSATATAARSRRRWRAARCRGRSARSTSTSRRRCERKTMDLDARDR